MRSIGCLALVLAGCASDLPAVPSDCDGDASEACRVFEIVNRERADEGLAPYTFDAELALAAQLHAEDMVANDYFDHVSLDGRSFVQRASETDYAGSPVGENIASGQTTPEQVMESWMGSDGHRRNILNASATDIGVGFEQNVWVQVFGAR
jgi:uncharacterized protein YkwD